jgi:hypothetical protein
LSNGRRIIPESKRCCPRTFSVPQSRRQNYLELPICFRCGKCGGSTQCNWI